MIIRILKKTLFSNYLKVDLFITHTKMSFDSFAENKLKTKIKWVPFTVSKNKFFQTKEKKYHVGMRSNNIRSWDDGLRENLYRRMQGLPKEKYKVDLHLCTQGTSFVYGKDYVDWLSKCHLLVNSPSAFGTVGPKFLEAIACNTVCCN